MKIDVPTHQNSNIQKLIYTIVIALLTWSSLFAQEVREGSREMSLGNQNSFYINIDNIDTDLAIDVWKDYMKEYGRVRRNRRAQEYYSMETAVSKIAGSKEINLYAKFEEGREQVATYLWVDLGGDFADSNENPDEAHGIRDFLSGYGVAVRKEHFSKLLKTQEKQLKKAKRGLEKLEKKNKNLHEDIEGYKKKIIKKEEDIATNLKEQEEQRMRIKKDERELEKLQESFNAIGKE